MQMWGSHSKLVESARRLEEKQETLPKVWNQLRACSLTVRTSPKITGPQGDLETLPCNLGHKRARHSQLLVLPASHCTTTQHPTWVGL